MPPKVRITPTMIIEAAFAIIRKQGADALNARAIAQELGCSTQPVLYQFATVEDVRRATYAYADHFHTQYVMQGLEESAMPLLALGQNYIRFAAQEQYLFRFLFQSSELGSNNLLSLMDDPNLTPMLSLFQQAIGFSPAATKRIFTQLFLVVHGYACLLANNPIPYNQEDVFNLLDSAFKGACAAENLPKED